MQFGKFTYRCLLSLLFELLNTQLSDSKLSRLVWYRNFVALVAQVDQERKYKYQTVNDKLLPY
jgi:hypothetical protein